MQILQALKQLRDDLKSWATNNFIALNTKIDEKTIPIDNELSSTSTNPVQNKAIKKAIDNIPKFSGDYNELVNAPDITEDESGNMVISDEAGNIIFRADADGIHTTAVSLNGETAATEKYVDDAVANIDIPEVDFTGYATEGYVDTAIQEAQLAGKEVDLSNYYTKQETAALIPDTSSFLTAVPADYVTESELNAKGFLTEHQSLEGLATTSEVEVHATDDIIHVSAAEKLLWNAKSNFSGDYNDLTNAPDISEDESGDLIIADANGNILFRSNSTGLETVNLTVETLTINGKSIQDMIRESVEEIMLGGKW